MDASVTWWLAFGAGVLSFISPCCLPLYPSYLSYITGISVSELKEDGALLKRRTAMVHTLFFMLGFSIIFLALGFSASLIGYLFSAYQDLIRQVGAILVIVMGLFLMGLFQRSFLMREKRLQLKNKPVGYLGSVLVGITFAAGWTPCIGPILSSVLILSASNPAEGIPMILSYILGFSIPFLAMAFFIGRMRFLQRYSLQLMRVGGGVMVLTGVLLFTDHLSQITVWLIRLFGGFTGF